jgi:pantoate--beta-alanine ligase
LQRLSAKIKAEGKTIGLVPTMGFLHEGHLSLVKKSKEKTDVTVVSIFVNPTQFSPTEDLEKYPRDIEHDKKILNTAGVDYVFIPQADEIYPDGFQTTVEVERITKRLEGEFRPAHFKGVTTVVSILFNIVKPDYAFFGQKDAQQAAVIKRMVKDLKMGLRLIICPIIREQDGLAKSSRNIYLSPPERIDALVLSRSLKIAQNLIKDGIKNADAIISRMKEEISSVSNSRLDYINIVDEENFVEVNNLTNGRKYYILVACKIGSTRLIDNVLIKV